MIDPGRFVEDLRAAGLGFVTGVPDSLLRPFCAYVIDDLPADEHVIAANEGAAVGLAMGSYLRTGAPSLVYLQNSGFGNTVNPLLSLADPDVYGIPMVLLVGWRGEPGVADEPQHVKQGRVMEALLDALELPWAVLPDAPDAASDAAATALTTAVERSCPSVLLVRKGTFAAREASERAPAASGRSGEASSADLASREDALAALVPLIGDDAIVVSTTGMLSRELFELRADAGRSGDRDLLTVGGMGHASSIALGVALHESDREVWCLDGDGALLMHLGAVATIAEHGPANFHHVVFNNGVHDSVGGQSTSIGVVDVAAAVAALGYRHAASTRDLDTLPTEVDALRSAPGPALLELRVRPGNRAGIGRPTRTPAESKRALMAALTPSPR
jgi:phosphonopyruvate decarboxylase